MPHGLYCNLKHVVHTNFSDYYINRDIYFHQSTVLQSSLKSHSVSLEQNGRKTPTTTPPPKRPVRITAGADAFGAPLKDALVAHLRFLGIDVHDLGTSSYFSVAADVGRLVSSSSGDGETRGLVACGTGAGVSIFANKFPGVYANTCLSVDDAVNARSINNSNVLAVSGVSTPPDAAKRILDAWLATEFKSPCPANGNRPWDDDVVSFLDSSLPEMSKIGAQPQPPRPPPASEPDDLSSPCALCSLAKNRELDTIDIIPGGAMKIVRESPTSAIVRFAAGSVEPAHHHTFGHDLVVIRGSKRVWNLSKRAKYDLGAGDYLFTRAGDVHRVKYFEETEFFIKWEGKWDILFNEDLEAAKDAIGKEAEDGFLLVK